MGVGGRHVVGRRRRKSVSGRGLARDPPASVLERQGREQPYQAYKGGNDRVCRDGRVGRVGKFQANPPVDDTQDYGASTEPQVQMRPGSPPAGFAQSDMV